MTAPPRRGEQGTPPEVWVVSLVGFIVTVGFGVIGPSLPALGDEFGAGTTMMSVAISGFAAARLVANLGFARFLERLKLRSVLWAGLMLQAACSAAAGLAPDYLSFIVLRSISGLGSAAFTVASSALLLALAPAPVRGRAMSIFAGATAFGMVTGPAIGGMLAVISPRLPLVAYGGILAVAALATFFLLGSAKDVTASRSAPTVGATSTTTGGALARMLADRLFVAALMCQVVSGWIFYGMRTATMPLDLAVLGYSAGVIGLLLSVSSLAQLVTAVTAGTVSDRVGRTAPLTVGLVLAVTSLVALDQAQIFVVAVVAFILLGLAGGSVVSVSTAMLGDSRIGRTGFGVAAYWVASDAAAVVGPVVSGVLAEKIGFGAAYSVAGVLTLLASVFVVRARRGGPPPHGASPS